MPITRRDLPALLPLLAAAAQRASAAPTPPPLPSHIYKFEDMPVKESANGNKARAMFDGATHTGYHIDVHTTELAPGQAPHAPHHHEHEELILVETGHVDVTIRDKTERIGPGGAALVASNEEHGWKNPGPGIARYFVIAFGRPF